MRTIVAACVGAAVTFAYAAAVNAQPPQSPPGQAKKQVPHQTPDHGDSDAARDLTPEEQAMVDRLFGKNENGVTLTQLANGGVRADLDDSFMEAMTVTVGADGALQFAHVTGLAKAADAVKAGAPKQEATTAKKPAPKLEEKE